MKSAIGFAIFMANIFVISLVVYLFVSGRSSSSPAMLTSVKKDASRFLPKNENIDVDMAMKLVLHDPPHFLHPPEKMPQLLINVPSAETLRELSG
jgi:hypothetical protein